MSAPSDDPFAVTAVPAAACPGLGSLLAIAAHAEGDAVRHLDGCTACRDRVLATRRRAGQLGGGGDAEAAGCDDVEMMLADLDDGAKLDLDQCARLLIHFAGCESCRAHTEPSELTPAPASVLDAPDEQLPIIPTTTYAIGSELARGGMGRILAAVDRRLGRPVAIKELLPAVELSFKQAVHLGARLEREARITARLNHPSIVSVHEAGKWPSGMPFYAMNLIAGESLDRVIAAAGSFPERLALLPHVIRVADALAYAHSEGIIHRDLKPANVLVGKFGQTVVIDWGLATEIGGPGDDPASSGSGARSGPGVLTEDGATVGTPAYMAPEQAAGLGADRGSDVYAIGAMLYQLLAGRPPHIESTVMATLAAARERDPEPLRAIEPRIPQALETIVGKAMAREPSDRYPSAGELADDLRRFETGQLVQAHEYGLLGLLRHWRAHRRVSVTVAAALATAAVAVGVAGLSGVMRESKRASAAADRAERFSEGLVVQRARAQIGRDPTAAIAWLRRLPISARVALDAENVAAEAEAEGVARHLLAGHLTSVSWAATSPDGRLLASGAKDGELRLWDLAAGRVRSLGKHDGEIYELAVSADGALVAVAGERGLELWSTRDGARRSLAGHVGPVYTVAFTADGGALVTGGEDGTARRTDVATGEARVLHGAVDAAAAERGPIREVLRVAPGAAHVYTAHAAAAGVTVVMTGGGKILALGADGRTRWEAEHPGGMPVGFSLAPRGDELATVGQDGVIRRWPLGSGAPIDVARAPEVVRVAYSPDGRWLAAAARTRLDVQVWDLRDGRARSFEGHTMETQHVAWSRDGLLFATAGADATVRVWDPVHGEQWTLRGHRGAVDWLAFGDGGVLFSHSVDGTARLWTPAPRPARILTGHPGGVYPVRYAAGTGQLATAGQDGVLRVYDGAAATSRVLRHPAAVQFFAISDDGRWAASTDFEYGCRLWDVTAGSARQLGERAACTSGVTFDPSGAWLATLDRARTLQVWRVDAAGPPVYTARDVLAVSWAGPSLSYVERDGVIARVKPPWSAPEAIGRAPRGQSATWSADGSTLHVRLRGAFSIVDVATSRLTQVAAPDAPLTRIILGSDGRRLVAGDQQGRLHVIDTATGAARVLTGHTRAVVAIALSPTGRRMASASRAELLLWDLESGRYQRLHAESHLVSDLAFSPAGDQLASGGYDGTVRLWPVASAARPPLAPAEVARALASATSAVLGEDDELVIAR